MNIFIDAILNEVIEVCIEQPYKHDNTFIQKAIFTHLFRTAENSVKF